jgi:hypothetical protein
LRPRSGDTLGRHTSRHLVLTRSVKVFSTTIDGCKAALNSFGLAGINGKMTVLGGRMRYAARYIGIDRRRAQ